MRKLISVVALLFCSMEVLAQCANLQGQCLKITTAGGSAGSLGQIDISPMFNFQTAVTFANGTDPVNGFCAGSSLLFLRVRQGAFVQTFNGTVAAKKVTGTFSQSGSQGSFQNRGWSATIGPCFTPTPVDPALQACLNACAADQDSCIHKLAPEYKNTSNQACVQEYTSCKAECKGPKKP